MGTIAHLRPNINDTIYKNESPENLIDCFYLNSIRRETRFGVVSLSAHSGIGPANRCRLASEDNGDQPISR